jgi:hypothetical protein
MSASPTPENPNSPGQSEPQQRQQRRQSSRDILPVLRGWDYEPGTINVRRVKGLDGLPKLQMRLDLGLLQMELTGRPDGQRPHGFESLLEYHEAQLEEHKTRTGTTLGFHLTGDECQSLRDEAAMYYHRYLSLFVLEDFGGVVRDTGRNLRVMDLCGRYAVEDQDRLILEQYRPYIVMMNVRGRASLLYKDGKHREAIGALEEGIEKIRAFFERFGQEEAFEQSSEVRVLRRFVRQIRKKMPVDPMQRLRARLDRAVRKENYEEAARLRDEIRRQTDQRA